jgi:hypothetical protein
VHSVRAGVESFVFKLFSKSAARISKALGHRIKLSKVSSQNPTGLALLKQTFACRPNSLFDFEGKHYDVFSNDFDNEAAASGKLDMFSNWDVLG